MECGLRAAVWQTAVCSDIREKKAGSNFSIGQLMKNADILLLFDPKNTFSGHLTVAHTKMEKWATTDHRQSSSSISVLPCVQSKLSP